MTQIKQNFIIATLSQRFIIKKSNLQPIEDSEFVKNFFPASLDLSQLDQFIQINVVTSKKKEDIDNLVSDVQKEFAKVKQNCLHTKCSQ